MEQFSLCEIEAVSWSCTFGCHHQYERLAQDGATDEEILELVEKMGNGGFRPPASIWNYWIEKRTDPPRIWWRDDGQRVTQAEIEDGPRLDAERIIAILRYKFRISHPQPEQIRLF